jgi:beta-mannosidase
MHEHVRQAAEATTVEDLRFTATEPGLAPSALDGSAQPWREASLPFEVHDALARAGRIPHPYLGDTAERLGWIQERSWWLSATVPASPRETTPGSERVLRLVGLDLAATLWLDGELAATHASLYRDLEIPLPGAATRAHELLIRIDPPLWGLEAPAGPLATARLLARKMGREPREEGQGMFGDPRTVLRRKPVVDFGWDFAPPLPSLGVRAIDVIERPQRRILDARLRTLALEEDGTAAVEVSARTTSPGEHVAFEIARPRGGADTVRAGAVADDAGLARARLRIPEADLWWTHDLGEPLLHTLSAVLPDGTGATRRVGIRTLALERGVRDGADGRGRDGCGDAGPAAFRFVLNGTRTFARGASIVPEDMLLPDDARVRRLTRLAREAGMTMLRVWGGGGYASDALLEAADELGLLIWQDAPFACSDQIETPSFLAEIEAEIRTQAARLAAHPSCALLTGGNEVLALHELAHGSLAPGAWGWHIVHELIPGVLAEVAPDLLYWPNSPYGEGDPGGLNGVADGDRHAWEVWHGLPLGAPDPDHHASFGQAAHFRRYRHDTGRFISEFGILSAACVPTLEQVLTPEQRRLDSPALRSRIRDEPKDKALAILEVETGVPSTLEEYVRTTQALQAEGMKYGIEHYRRQEPWTSGALVWQLNEPWPGMTWSLVDHSLRRKQAFHAVRRSFAPVIASFEDVGGVLRLWAVNSTAQSASLRLAVRLERADGTVLLQDEAAGSVPAHGAAVLWSLPASASPFDAPDEHALPPDVIAWVRNADGAENAPDAVRTARIPENRLLGGALQDLPLPAPDVRARVLEAEGDRALLRLEARTLALGLTLTLGAEDLEADDNAIDLGPGRTRDLEIRAPHLHERLGELRLSAYTPPGSAPALWTPQV